MNTDPIARLGELKARWFAAAAQVRAEGAAHGRRGRLVPHPALEEQARLSRELAQLLAVLGVGDERASN